MNHFLHCLFVGFEEALLAMGALGIIIVVFVCIKKVFSRFFEDEFNAVMCSAAIMLFLLLTLALTLECLHPEAFK